MNRPFSIHRLYRNLDKWKNLHHKQILYKHKIKFRYNKLMEDYKKVIVENVNLKSEIKNIKHTG